MITIKIIMCITIILNPDDVEVKTVLLIQNNNSK